MYEIDKKKFGALVSQLRKEKGYTGFISGSVLSVGGTPIPNYVWYAAVITVIIWFIWNKTAFGKNMFAVGSNPEAANVSGVNVKVHPEPL